MPSRRATSPRRGFTIATIDDLLARVDSKYTLVHLAARRAREINSYYHSLGEGLGQYTPPLVDQVDSNKPLSIGLEEIAREKIVPQYAGDAERVADELLELDAPTEEAETDSGAEVVSLTPATELDEVAPDETGALDVDVEIAPADEAEPETGSG